MIREIHDDLRRQQLEELRRLRGKLRLRTNWRQPEQLELRELRRLFRQTVFGRG